jgi:gliding motility-associated-like protein
MKKFIVFGLFVLLFLQVQAQEPNDCSGAITVCGNGNFSSNASGIGDIQEVSGCGSSEHNSLWLEVNIVQDGTLGFNLIPDDPDILVDYDFWVYGPDRLCSNLGSPIRCATTNPNAAGLPNNHTGIDGSTTLTQTGPDASGNGYVYWLSVLPGQTYYLVVDRPHGDGGFEIEWTGTAMDGTGAFPTPPTATEIDDVIACSGTPDVSIFNLEGLKSSINSDLSNNTVEFFANLSDATDGVSALPGIYANTSNPQTIYAKVLSSVTDCYSLIDFDLIVSPIPDATVSASDTEVCEGESVTFSFSGTENATVHYNINSGTTQSIVLDNTGLASLSVTLTTNTTLTLENAQVINSENAIVCSQILTESVTVSVNPIVTPVFTQVPPICSGETLASLPTTSNNSVTGTWSPVLDNTVTTTYTFTPGTGQCATTETMTIIVNPIVTPIFTQVPPICSGETLAALPATSNNGITGTWSPALDNTTTTTYTFTPDVEQCAVTEILTIIVNPNITPTFTQVPPICSGETIAALPTTSNNGITGIWSPVLDNTATTTYTFMPDAGQCAFSETMTITVNSNITPTFTQVPPICSGEALAALPTTSNNSVIGTWSPAIDNTTTTTYTFTPNGSVCATTQTMVITVNPSVSPTFTQVQPICSGEALSALPNTSNNSITGTWSPAVDNTTTTTYTFTPDAGQCAASQVMTITVNPIITPTFTQRPAICSGKTLNALPTTSNNSVIGTWSPALNNTTTTTYTFTPATGECATTQTMSITVNPNVTPTFTQESAICSGETLNALPTTSNNGISGTWSPALDNTTTTTYTFTPAAGECATTQTMTIIVNPILKPVISSLNGLNTLCVDFVTGAVQNEITLISDLQNTNYNYSWYLNGTAIVGANQSTYTVDTAAPGLYTLSIEEILPTANCTSEISEAFEIIQSGQAVFVNITQTGSFEPNPTITITVEGYGDYWFQLNDGPILNNGGVFNNVSSGVHTVYVHDRATGTPSCDFITIDNISIINFPKILTPNNDGYNDTWNVFAVSNQPNTLVNIYDRYGKLLKQLHPNAPGWDGTYNGSLLPSNDYWFELTYEEAGEIKQFRSHFTLKR